MGLSFRSWLALTGNVQVTVFGGWGGFFSCSIEILVYMLRKRNMLSLSHNHTNAAHQANITPYTTILQAKYAKAKFSNITHMDFYTWHTK